MSYPSYPTNPRLVPRSINFVAKTQATSFTSPFTAQTQNVRYTGQYWQLDLQYAPLFQSDALELMAFFNSLNGMDGKFHFTPPSKFLMSGSLSTTMTDTNTFSATNGQTGKFGIDGSYRLIQFTGTSSLFPAHASGSSVSIGTSAGALFRLASNELPFSFDEAIMGSVAVGIVEAI